MSLWRDELRPSRATNATIAALAIVAIGSLGRVIEPPDYLVWAIPAAAIGAAFALLFGRRSLGAGFAMMVLVGFLTLPALFVTKETKYLLPSPDAIRALRKLIASGLHDSPQASAPVEALAKYNVLIWCSLLLLGFLGAAWIVVRRPVGAVTTALGVVVFSGSIGDGGGRTVVAVAAVAATIAFFLAEGRQRIGRWAGARTRIPSWFGVPTLGAACAAALVAPIVFGEAPLVELNGALRPRIVIIKPLSEIQRQLKIDPPIEVMRVSADTSTYWRLTSLDEYDGREWKLVAHPRDVRNGVVPRPSPPSTGTTVEQHYVLTSLLSPWLPAAYAARVVGTDAAVQVDKKSQTLLLRDKTTPGLSYTVRSVLPKITVDEGAKPRGVSSDAERLFGGYARPLVAGATTPLEMSRRLERYFRRFAYSEDVPAGHTVARLQRFLSERRGYCEQFAAAMTLMLRGLGVDARVGVGFLPGEFIAGDFIVSTRDAHAWVEADIPGAGWTYFDPTPGRGASSTVPKEVEKASALASPPQVTNPPAPTPPPENVPPKVARPAANARVPTGVLWAIAALIVLGAIPGAKRIRQKRRQRGAPAEAIVGAFTELIDRARDLGVRARASETHREFCDRVGGPNTSSFTELARATARVIYGATEPTRDDAQRAWRSLRTALRALHTRTPAWRRAIAAFDPRTFLGDRPISRARLRIASTVGRA